ncbi:V-type ATP synthase subunit B [Aminiphilus circumscriptus]|uniref:V-type ATP synthase subunit B n=1 Tax=Aminiphilus circumscriptus TaxID=290732 RepID=UPI0004B2E23B
MSPAMRPLYREGYRTVRDIVGPLLFVEGVRNAGYGETVTVESPQGIATGQILLVEECYCAIQLFEGTMGLDAPRSTVYLERDIVRIPVGKMLMGRILDGRFRPLDGKPAPLGGELMSIQGEPLNPTQRIGPDKFVETGISTIDLMNTLVRGQKLPIFSGAGLPAARIAAQIATQARVPGSEQSFLVVFAAMGVTQQEARYFMDVFSEAGVLAHGVFFLNLASDSPVERLLTPRMALAVAEYFAFTLDYDVLVVLTDMLQYCEALREISAAREEMPGRRGFPGYMYSDLSTIYERAGSVKGRSGSITQIPIITMPDDDMTHPVVDLSGYITEGQIVLSRDMNERGLFPPVSVLPSLSRLMNKGVGRGKTFPEHRALADQLYASYAKGKDLERLKLIVGEEGLSPVEQNYLSFAKVFEERFVHQGKEDRSLESSMRVGMECLSLLPRDELYRLPEESLQRMAEGRAT